ncbi:MAG: 2Fe-2S iron-sulfur cluster binding domain-containing protein [Limnohabitans sp.]|jgi:2Fe-2S ferredoxin|nr:2Fe-2S iron-sulfur cluster binding domain-containing protein [Limnohabitans sp.]
MSTVTIHLTRADGQTRTITGQSGQSLMKAAIAADVDEIAADCGGTLVCATCHVHVREPWLSQLPAVASDEDSMLDFAASPRDARSRLSCQITLTPALDGLEVDLPPTQY